MSKYSFSITEVLSYSSRTDLSLLTDFISCGKHVLLLHVLQIVLLVDEDICFFVLTSSFNCNLEEMIVLYIAYYKLKYMHNFSHNI